MYYLRLSKHGRKVYNFDDPIEYGDNIIEAHMDDDKPIGVHHYITEGDVVMHDAPCGEDHGAGFGTNYDDTTSIMTMLQDMQMRDMMRIVNGERPLKLHKWSSSV